MDADGLTYSGSESCRAPSSPSQGSDGVASAIQIHVKYLPLKFRPQISMDLGPCPGKLLRATSQNVVGRLVDGSEDGQRAFLLDDAVPQREAGSV